MNIATRRQGTKYVEGLGNCGSGIAVYRPWPEVTDSQIRGIDELAPKV
jgi:hypothetical protein